MKLLTLLTIFCAGAVCAQEPVRKRQVRVDVLMVSVPEAKGLPLIPKLRDPKTVEATQAKLVEMIAAKEAELLDWPEVTVPDGSRSVSENIVEQRYPIAYEQPQIPGPFGNVRMGIVDVAHELIRASGLIVPTTFETRNVGALLECDCTVSEDGREASLRLAAQFVHFLGMEAHPAGKSDTGHAISVSQPNFRTTKTSLNVTLKDGEHRLLVVGKPKEPAGTLFFFVAGVQIEPPRK